MLQQNNLFISEKSGELKKNVGNFSPENSHLKQGLGKPNREETDDEGPPAPLLLSLIIICLIVATSMLFSIIHTNISFIVILIPLIYVLSKKYY